MITVKISDMLVYSSFHLKESLLMFPDELQEFSRQIQKCIKKTIANVDKHRSLITETKYIMRLFDIAIHQNASLRDEIYCQLVRESNCNPNGENVRFVYQIMFCCLAVFPPSKLLHPYLRAYLKKSATSRENSSQR